MHITQFKALARAKRARAVDVHKDMQSIVTPVAGQDRVIRYTISTPTVDRDKDTISVDGWDLQNFRKNPIVLWSHETHKLPVGRVVEIGVKAQALVADVLFVDADIPVAGPVAEAVYQLSAKGFLSATSVGFAPIDWDFTTDEARGANDWLPGIDFRRQELRELSIVTVPANPEALIDPSMRMLLETAPPKRGELPQIKSLWDVGALAGLLAELGWLRNSAEWEGETEGDASRVPALLGEALQQLGTALIVMTEEEVAELLASHGVVVPAADETVYVEAAATPAARQMRAGFAAMKRLAAHPVRQTHGNPAALRAKRQRQADARILALD